MTPTRATTGLRAPHGAGPRNGPDPGPPLTAARATDRPRALILGSGYAGHRTRFANLRQHLEAENRLDATYRLVSGWREDGAIERFPLLPSPLKGRVRALTEGASVARFPGPAVIWTAATSVLGPYAWSQIGPLRRPLVLDLDWTLEQQERLAPHYFGREAKHGPAAWIARWQERLAWRATTVFTPWSQWAADSLRRHGIEESRIRVLPPGVDLDRWRLMPPPPARERLRLLFVGGDFRRKGGDLVLEAMRGPFRNECELIVVTHDDVPAALNVRVLRARPNSPELLALYAAADLFVMPSHAECFGLSTIEAMATGRPTIVSNVGASPEIVEHDVTGWVIEPTGPGLEDALWRAVRQREALPELGRRARRRVEQHFDGVANDRAVADLLLDLARSR